MMHSLMASQNCARRTLEHMRRALETHMDPEGGSPYWIEQARVRGVRPDDIRGFDDLAVLGPMDEEAMRLRPLRDFIPRSVRNRGVPLIPTETGATTGPPKMAVFTPEEFAQGFVEPFLRVAEYVGFPRGGQWMFVGPTGPHIIGRAARHLAMAMGADEPFTVDFDPRWHRRLVPGSLAQRRHLDHIVEQASHILERAEIDVLFTTPSVLRELLRRMDEAQRLAVRGVHVGGQTLTEPDALLFREGFPQAVHLGGYGNSLVGVCMEVPGSALASLAYHATPPRHAVRVLADPATSLTRRVAPGERGRVLFHRFDESFLILNMVERDVATRLPPSEVADSLGLDSEGLGDLGPATLNTPSPMSGIY